MKKVLCLFLVLPLLLCGCFPDEQSVRFHIAENGNLVSDSGEEYAQLAQEGILYFLGDLEFYSRIVGEKKTSQHLGVSYQIGLFAIANDETNNILIRRAPNNEWISIYRKTSLPPFDFSVDNCIRLELVTERGNDTIHVTCGDGLSVKSEIADFLSDVRSQPHPQEAGLYDLVRKPDGSLENCYRYAVIYGFFADEPNIVIYMEIDSYNDLAYSVTIEGNQYVLPVEWLQKLQS